VLFCVFFCVCKCVLCYCHRLATKLHLTNVSYHIRVLWWCYVRRRTTGFVYCVRRQLLKIKFMHRNYVWYLRTWQFMDYV
jgi:hypothetical protein